jgi:hypothetical protein
MRDLQSLIAWATQYHAEHGERPKLRVSVSGGRTSMFMAKWCKENLGAFFDILFMFANTSREHADTYRFLEAGDRAFGLGLTLIEAVVHRTETIAKACTGKAVGYGDLRKDGSIFREVCAAYGLPNQTFKLCTRELKTNPMDKYAESIGFGDALVAIGIRADETRRVSPTATKNGIIYPLVDFVPTTKLDVLEYFEQFDWDLRIPEHDGNCVDCHKKSDRKLQAVYVATPEVFDWSQQLDDDFKGVGPNSIGGVRVDEPRKRWRGYRDTRELLEALRTASFHALAVTDGGCSESCEVYETEEVAQ